MKKMPIVFLFSTLLLLCCSSSEEDDNHSNTGAWKVTVRFVDQQGQLIRENVELNLSSIRKDYNTIIPFADTTATTGSYTFAIYKSSVMIITAVAPNYNPVREELALTASAKEVTIDVEMKPRSGLRLLGYNVKDGWEHTNAKIAAFTNWVKRYDPDIILFCELNNNVLDNTAIRTDDELLALSKKWGHNHAAILKNWGYPTGITSRYEITDIEKVQLETKPKTGYRVHGFIQAKCKGLDLFACHLSSQDVKTREIEAEEIAGRAKQSAYAVISGDMNTDSRLDEEFVPGSLFQTNHWYDRENEYSVMDKYLNANFVDAFWLFSTAYKTSFPTDRNYATLDQLGLRIDYMMLSPKLAEKCDFFDTIHSTYTKGGSDHFPNFMHLEIGN